MIALKVWRLRKARRRIYVLVENRYAGHRVCRLFNHLDVIWALQASGEIETCLSQIPPSNRRLEFYLNRSPVNPEVSDYALQSFGLPCQVLCR